jgi:hypothetical protein
MIPAAGYRIIVGCDLVCGVRSDLSYLRERSTGCQKVRRNFRTLSKHSKWARPLSVPLVRLGALERLLRGTL